jgi:CDP-diacylglycerol--glycerol-3-phosphate 3-phosphatidyltransferase
LPSIYALKSRFQDLLRPLVRALHGAGATANQVTVFAAVASLAVAAFVGFVGGVAPGWFALLPAWLFARMALNAVDGMLAREFGQQSRLGGYLNELGDVVADAALYLSLLAVPGLGWPTPVALALLASWSELAGVLGPAAGASRRYDGPMGKGDRAFVVGALGLLLAFGWIGATVVAWVLAAACALCALTVINRVRHGLAEGAANPSTHEPEEKRP